MEDTITADSGTMGEVSDNGLDIASASDGIARDLGLSSNKPVEEETGEEQDIVADATAEAKVTEKTAASVPEKRPLPQSWKKDMQEKWDKLDPDTQTYFEHREKQMAEGLEKDRNDANLGRTMRDIMTPYRAMLQAQGVDEPGAVKALLNAHYKLTNSDPAARKEMFLYLARNYGIELEGLANSDATQQVDPVIKSLRDELNGIKSTLTASREESFRVARERALDEVNTFASDLEHPYFDEVANDIAVMIQAGHSLKDAYDKAVWANPVTRQKELERVSQDTEKRIREKAREEAEKAKKAAGTNVRGRDLTKTPTEPKGTMEDTMRETLRQIKSRTH